MDCVENDTLRIILLRSKERHSDECMSVTGGWGAGGGGDGGEPWESVISIRIVGILMDM